MALNTPQHDVDDDAARRRLRRIFVRVMIVQAATLALLWLLESRYSP
jgi:hypothetical protein